jgi:hypothetical protein
MKEMIRLLIKNISSNYIRARQAEQDADSRIELRHLLWASRDIHRLLLLWVAGKSEVDDSTAQSYAESARHTAERVRELVAARVKR